ncbi:hypothetical protein ABK040_014959 [Willaertia magna]
MWFGNLVSVLGSILGKRTNKEINNNLNKPETKKKKQGKNKNIEKEVIKCTVLDFLSAFVDQDQTKRRVDDLTDTEINNLTEKQPDLKSWIESIAKTPIPQLWQTHLEHCKVKTAFIYMINALGITLGNNLIPLFEHSKGVNIEQLLHDYDSDLIVQLCALEQTNFIHNDVKPENMVKYDEHWFLIDYEISLIFDPQKETKSESFTFGYRAPERRIDNLVSPKSDVYSLGLVILEILKGKRRNSWESKDEKEIFQKCDKLAIIDKTILKLLKSMLRQDSKQRSSPLDLVNLLKLDEAIQPKLKETIRYFKERERFWHLVKTKDTEIVRALDFIQNE